MLPFRYFSLRQRGDYYPQQFFRIATDAVHCINVRLAETDACTSVAVALVLQLH